MELFSIIVLLFSGFGAGIMTGLIGGSAVTFMAGILIILLNFSAYTAVGLSLLTDVFASLTSAYIYKKSNNIDIKKGSLIGFLAIIFAFIGSLLARCIPDLALNDGLGIITLITGIAFLKNPLKKQTSKWTLYFKNKELLGSIIIGVIIGLFCGFFGVGGGIGISVALIFIMKFPIKIAVGTSVLIMSFISLSGGIGHFVGLKFPIYELIITSIGSITGAIIASKYVNKISEQRIFKITGLILILISFAIIFRKFLYMLGISFF